MSPRSRDAFLLGSGVSTPIAPSTAELTHEVLHGLARYHLQSNERWEVAPTSTTVRGEERSERVRVLLDELLPRIERFYAGRENPAGCLDRSVSYEDLGYVADSIVATLTLERDDPAIAEFIAAVMASTSMDRAALLEAADDTLNYLRDVVHIKLASLEPSANHLRTVVDACRLAVEPFPIYTLNHDCLIEATFRSHALECDEFLRPDGDRLVLRPSAPVNAAAKACLFKMHGSVSWRRFNSMRQHSWFNEWVGHERDIHGQRHEEGLAWRCERPLILLGRFNKELGYLDQPFLDVLSAFSASIRTRDRLFVSGYGFGDKAINTMLIDWAFGASGKKIIVMHRDEAALVNGARGAIRKHWPRWKSLGILEVVPRFLSDCAWQDLAESSRPHG